MPVLRRELALVAQMWNMKDIHVAKNSELHGGKPDIMFFLPEAYDARNHLVNVNEEDLMICTQSFGEQAPDYSPELAEIIELLSISKEEPMDSQQALHKFRIITHQLKNICG